MKMVVGLGNPGPRYELTRHNAGFLALDLLADRTGVRFGPPRGQARLAEGRQGGKRVLLVKPLTYMNLSGEAVAPLVRFYRLELSDLLVLHDDLDLPPGGLRVRPGGGDGGHRGIRSLIDTLGGAKFTRVRIGIGRPPEKWDPADYVLTPFQDEDWALVQPALERAAAAAEALLTEDAETVMNRFNG